MGVISEVFAPPDESVVTGESSVSEGFRSTWRGKPTFVVILMPTFMVILRPVLGYFLISLAPEYEYSYPKHQVCFNEKFGKPVFGLQTRKNVKIQKKGSSENFGGLSNFRSNVRNLEKR